MNFPRRILLLWIALAPGLGLTAHAARLEADLSGPGWKLWEDADAKWQNDDLFLPPVNLSQVPVNPPTGGWSVLASNGLAVSVPGTVEEYLSPGNGPDGAYKGVSWWWRTLRIPEHAGHRIVLHFESQRQRAEIYVDHQLVGYDVIGGTPFDVDLTGRVQPGQTCELAVRITNPGGNYDWRDTTAFLWNSNSIPISHGFGGITGPVKLVTTEAIYVDDIYVQNTPAITNVNVQVTLNNTTGDKTVAAMAFKVFDKNGYRSLPLCAAKLPEVVLAPGLTVVTQTLALAKAKWWNLDSPKLYICDVSLMQPQGTSQTANAPLVDDSAEQTFGFRWFAPEDVGTNAVFRLNGKRIVLRTSISWGFWPINGIFPTPELAEQQIKDAKAFGMNMLNFHRCIGQPLVLDTADELGLLYYQEPGGYKSAAGDAFADALMREKVLRMVKRDRSHPSLVIFSLINERDGQPLQARERRDLLAVHELDPSRTITLTSAWATRVDGQQDVKANFRPFDSELHLNGWYDVHHAGGPEVWRQNLYVSPVKYYNYTANRKEIVYWGEEGAISAPPRLDLIKAALDASPVKGWDGQTYLDWYQRFDDFLTRKNLRAAFPTVAALTTSMGAVSYYHQGRKIETMRLGDVTDGYAINGWEAESIENHSGIVDCWRNPKADPAILAYYNQPLYVAVKVRSQFAQIPGSVSVDFYGINEQDLHGNFTLKISGRTPAGAEIFATNLPVTLTGGEVYGELLAADVRVPIAGATGMFQIQAGLADAAGSEVATGHDEVLAVDWQSQKLAGAGATWENTPHVRDFLARQKSVPAADYRDDLGRLDWVVTTRPPGGGQPVEIPAEAFGAGLAATFFAGSDFLKVLSQRTDRAVDFSVPDGAVPDPKVNLTENYSVRWEGSVTPPVSGNYDFATESGDGVKLWVDGQLLFDDLNSRPSPVNRGQLTLTAGKPVTVRLDFWHRKGNAQCKLQWAPPEAGAPDAEKLMQRVHDDGTTLVILERADAWMHLITNHTAVKYNGSFVIGTAWLGGIHFVRAHPLFQDLPVDTAMSWPYQAVVLAGRSRSALRLEGEELVAGAWHSFPMDLGTAVGVIPYGHGRIIVSTLNIAGELDADDTSADVARKLLCNFIAYAGGK